MGFLYGLYVVKDSSCTRCRQDRGTCCSIHAALVVQTVHSTGSSWLISIRQQEGIRHVNTRSNNQGRFRRTRSFKRRAQTTEAWFLDQLKKTTGKQWVSNHVVQEKGSLVDTCAGSCWWRGRSFVPKSLPTDCIHSLTFLRFWGRKEDLQQ